MRLFHHLFSSNNQKVILVGPITSWTVKIIKRAFFGFWFLLFFKSLSLPNALNINIPIPPSYINSRFHFLSIHYKFLFFYVANWNIPVLFFPCLFKHQHQSPQFAVEPRYDLLSGKLFDFLHLSVSSLFIQFCFQIPDHLFPFLSVALFLLILEASK